MVDQNTEWRVFLSIVLFLCIALAPGPGEVQAAEKRIVFLPGHQSHGWSGHAYTADCKLLARLLNENVAGVEAVVVEGGWPADTKVLEGAAAIVIGCDGNSLIGPEANWKTLDDIARKGTGLGFLHYSLDAGKANGKYLLDWIGGYYEQNWSVNPSWRAEFKTLPAHSVAQGVKPFSAHDEWYYHMRFVEAMKDVTPILTAVPPNSTRERPDGPHSNNPTVRAGRGQAEHVMWVYQRPDGGRGFGCTGGHTHWVYAQDDFRTLLLNSICWIAKADVPVGGVTTPTPTVAEMEANLEGDRPSDWTRERTERTIEELNRS